MVKPDDDGSREAPSARIVDAKRVVAEGGHVRFVRPKTLTQRLRELFLDRKIEIGTNIHRINDPTFPTYRRFAFNAQKIRQRALDWCLKNDVNWDRAWRMGALSIRIPNGEGLVVDSPDGDYHTFVEIHLDIWYPNPSHQHGELDVIANESRARWQHCEGRFNALGATRGPAEGEHLFTKKDWVWVQSFLCAAHASLAMSSNRWSFIDMDIMMNKLDAVVAESNPDFSIPEIDRIIRLTFEAIQSRYGDWSEVIADVSYAHLDDEEVFDEFDRDPNVLTIDQEHLRNILDWCYPGLFAGN